MAKIVRLTEQDLVRLVNRVINEQEQWGDLDSDDLKNLLLKNGFRLLPNAEGRSGWTLAKGKYEKDWGGMKTTGGMYMADCLYKQGGATLTDNSKGQEVILPGLISSEDYKGYSIVYYTIDKKGNKTGSSNEAKIRGQDIVYICNTFGDGMHDLFSQIKLYSMH
jgi:hypothetical protein